MATPRSCRAALVERLGAGAAARALAHVDQGL